MNIFYLDINLKCLCEYANSPIGKIINFIGNIYQLLIIATPIILIIWGIIDLLKGVVASKEDEIKKGQQALIKRAIAAVIVFFVAIIIKFVVNIVDTNNDYLVCADYFLGNKAQNTAEWVESANICGSIEVDDSSTESGYGEQSGTGGGGEATSGNGAGRK